MIAIEQLFGPTPDAAALIAELDGVLGAVYEPEQRHGISIEQVFQPNVRFFVARLGEAAVGCGAVALFEGYAEVKRMYTRESVRGRGVGKALLARIEQMLAPRASRSCVSKPAPFRRRRSPSHTSTAPGPPAPLRP